MSAGEDRIALDFERAMDKLFTDYDFRHREPDPFEDAADEALTEAMHEPHRPMGGSDEPA